MVDLPRDILDNTFNKKLKKGTIVLTKFLCHDGVERPHYHIILNHNNADQNLLYVISTSQLDFYNRNPTFNKDIVRILLGQVSCLSKESIFDCRQISKISRENFKQRYADNSLEFVGELNQDIIEKLNSVIHQSKFVSKDFKKKILGPDFN